MEEKFWALMWSAIFLGLFATIVITTNIIVSAGTVRHNDCVSNGGSYVKVPNEPVWECRN